MGFRVIIVELVRLGSLINTVIVFTYIKFGCHWYPFYVPGIKVWVPGGTHY